MHLKSRFFGRALAAAAIVACASYVVTAQTRIYFAHNATRATVRGSLRGIRDEVLYVLRARAGQHMRVDIRGRGATRGTVTFPNGRQDGGPGGVVFDGILPDTGDYTIRVTESSMGSSWSGGFTMTVDVLSEGGGERRGSSDLTRYVGLYPSEMFRREPSIKTRLRSLLGGNNNSFFQRIQTEMPIENDHGALIVRGCMAHACGSDEAILVITSDESLHVALRFRGEFRTWGGVPTALSRAMRQ